MLSAFAQMVKVIFELYEDLLLMVFKLCFLRVLYSSASKKLIIKYILMCLESELDAVLKIGLTTALVR